MRQGTVLCLSSLYRETEVSKTKKAFLLLLVLAVTMLLTATCGAALAADEADQGLIDIAEERAVLLAEMFPTGRSRPSM